MERQIQNMRVVVEGLLYAVAVVNILKQTKNILHEPFLLQNNISSIKKMFTQSTIMIFSSFNFSLSCLAATAIELKKQKPLKQCHEAQKHQRRWKHPQGGYGKNWIAHPSPNDIWSQWTSIDAILEHPNLALFITGKNPKNIWKDAVGTKLTENVGATLDSPPHWTRVAPPTGAFCLRYKPWLFPCPRVHDPLAQFWPEYFNHSQGTLYLLFGCLFSSVFRELLSEEEA